MAPTSNQAGGYNNWYWYGTVWDAGANAFRADINIANFNNTSSNYLTHIYVYDNAGNQGTKYDLGAIYIKAPGLSVDQFKIGDYVAYQPNTPANATYSTVQDGINRNGSYDAILSRNTSLMWRVLSVNGNTLSLVSETIPSEKLSFRGFNGYNNGVKLLNDACNTLYKNTTLGATGRNMNIDDINNLMGVTEATIKSIDPSYGNEYTLNGYLKEAPEIFQYEAWGGINGNYTGSLGFSEQNQWYSGSRRVSILKGKSSYYEYTLSNYKATNTVQHALCTGGANNSGTTSHNGYWLASRTTQCNSSRFTYGLHVLSNGEIRCCRQFYSNDNDVGAPLETYQSIRPVVGIDVTRVYIGNTGIGTRDNPYSIQAR